MSDVLNILEDLSLIFQQRGFNLLSMESVLKSHKSSLESLRNDPLLGGYMIQLVKDYSENLEAVNTEMFITMCSVYLNLLLEHLEA